MPIHDFDVGNWKVDAESIEKKYTLIIDLLSVFWENTC